MTGRNFNVWKPDDVRVPIKLWTRGVQVEDSALDQLHNVARLPFVFHHVAAMPDVHTGMGATIGSVIATQGAVIPAAVGVDIGCGMTALCTHLTAGELPDLPTLRTGIERQVPHGRSCDGGPGDKGAWGYERPESVRDWWRLLEPDYREIIHCHPEIAKSNSDNHLGTLGTGNHFIEVCLDETDHVWILLHSGSRGVGGKIGSYFTRMARNECRRWHVNLPDPALAFFPDGTAWFEDYMDAANWAQRYAKANRAVMLAGVRYRLCCLCGWNPDALDDGTPIDCHHNYVDRENHFGRNVLVTRKGAVRARKGDMGIIPGSMGAKSYIVQGKGEPESFCSCSHGAGRAMSRTAARQRFTVADHEKATAGVECRKDAEVLDETPGAYKPIDAVMAAQTDLVEILHELRAVVCVKG